MFWSCSYAAERADSVAFSEKMDEFVVTGRSGAFSVSSSTPVQVFSISDAERVGVQDLSDVLRRMSGVAVKDYGGIGGLKTVSVRSLGSGHTAVAYDGVPVSDCQNGQIDLGKFSLDNLRCVSLSIVESNDIFRPARLFSSAATVELCSEKPMFEHDNRRFVTRLQGGSFGLVSPYLRYEQNVGVNSAFSVSGSYYRADGNYPFRLKNGNLVTKERRSNSDVEAWTGEANFWTDVSERSSLSAKVYFYGSERGLPGGVIYYNSFSKESLCDRIFFGQADFRSNLSSRFSLQFKGKFNWSRTHYHDEGAIYPNGRVDDKYFQQEFYFSAGLRWRLLHCLDLACSSDYIMNGLNVNQITNVQPERYSFLNVVALKYSDRKIRAVASLLSTVCLNYTERGVAADDEQRLSPSVSVSYKPFDADFNVRASFKDGFRVPTFNENYFDRVGSKNLVPERAKQFNFGIAYASDVMRSFAFSADAYYNMVDDKIVAMPKMFVWSMINMGRVDIYGVDVNAEAFMPLAEWAKFFVRGNYMLQVAEEKTDGSVNYGSQIPYTPEHSGSCGLAWENGFLNVSYNVSFVGERYSLPGNSEANKMEAYGEHCLSLYRSFVLRRCKLSIRGDVQNLTNKQYEVVRFFPMPGRSYRLSLALSL